MTGNPRLPVHPLDPDPLSVSDDPWADGYFEGWEVGFRAARNRRPAIVAVVAAAISGAVVATTLLLAGHVLAAPRSGLQSGDSFSAGRSEAPQAVVTYGRTTVSGLVPGPVGASLQGPSAVPPPLAAPTQLSDEGGVWGTPPDTATDLRQGRTGIIAQAKGHGPNYLAIPIGPGHLVEVCGPAACWTTVSTDGGPNRAMLKTGRIADVAVGHWVTICGVPAVLGLCDGSWHVVSAGTTPPPTDVTP